MNSSIIHDDKKYNKKYSLVHLFIRSIIGKVTKVTLNTTDYRSTNLRSLLLFHNLNHLYEATYLLNIIKYVLISCVIGGGGGGSCPDHTKICVRFQSWNYWEICLRMMLGHRFSFYYSRRCRQMVIELAGVFSPSRALHPTMTMDRHQYTYMYNSKVTLSIIKKNR